MEPGVSIAERLLYKEKPSGRGEYRLYPVRRNLQGRPGCTLCASHGRAGTRFFHATGANTIWSWLHFKEPKERGKGYDYTLYSATLTVYVPQICPCCGG